MKAAILRMFLLLMCVQAAFDASAQSVPEGQGSAPETHAPGFWIDPATKLAGTPKKQQTVTWHVKDNLFLTGNQWSSNYRMDDRGRPSGYAYYFDFNEGKPNDDPTGFLYPFTFMRALCVRGPGK
jgi:hypothetical protein